MKYLIRTKHFGTEDITKKYVGKNLIDCTGNNGEIDLEKAATCSYADKWTAMRGLELIRDIDEFDAEIHHHRVISELVPIFE